MRSSLLIILALAGSIVADTSGRLYRCILPELFDDEPGQALDPSALVKEPATELAVPSLSREPVPA